MRINNIIVCGGHFSPALVVIEKLKQKKKYHIYYVGRRQALEGDRNESLEYHTVREMGIPFFSILTGRLQRSFTLYTLTSLVKIPIGILQSLCILKKLKPILVLSFGGYVALPVSLSAWVLGIPVITHEQTPVLGLSNRIIAKIARVVCLSWPQTKYVSRETKTVLTGNPVRIDSLQKNTDLTEFGNHNLPLIYVTGGSLGAQSINQVLSKIISQLVQKFRILHQCGSAGNSADFKKLLSIKNTLTSTLGQNYEVVEHIDPIFVGSILRESILVIGRAGANTIAEIAVSGVPSILIPLPWAADNEQEMNARLLEKTGLVKVIKQSDLISKRLREMIDYMVENISDFRKNRHKAASLFRIDAGDNLVEAVESILLNHA